MKKFLKEMKLYDAVKCNYKKHTGWSFKDYLELSNNPSISGLFVFANTPQGSDFWRMVDKMYREQSK